MSEEQRHPQETALHLLFEDPSTPIEKPNTSCLTNFSNVMYTYYRSYVYPLMDYDYKFKDEDWEIPFESLTNMEYVGAGAFGKVYSAKLQDEVVAVKIPEDKKEIDMKYLKELRHENIVRFRGVCNNTATPCLVMEFCQYGSLYNFLHSGTRIMINVTFKWAKEIALAMAYLHSRNIIHRDLKSPNILIADNLVVKITDFGTSRKWEKFSFVMTTRGTTYWMAPEMMLGKKCSDRVDVWSYGVVLWELLTQEVPYENLHPCAVTYGVGKESISLPLPSTFPLHLRILMNHCWHRNPKSRPSFHRITEVLSLASEQWSWLGDELFMTMQDAWRQEVRACKKNGWHAVPAEQVNTIQPQKQNRIFYRKIMREASKMYLDACSLYLRLEQREVALTEREMAYNGLLNHRSLFNYHSRSRSARRSSSSSSSPKIPKAQAATQSLGQMTVVKLHNLNRKPRTTTELAASASDVTKPATKVAISKTPVIKTASPKVVLLKTAAKEAGTDTAVSINAKTGTIETAVVKPENKTRGVETVLKVNAPMIEGFDTTKNEINAIESAVSEFSVDKANDIKNDVNNTVDKKGVIDDIPVHKIKKTAGVPVTKPFGAKTTMKEASMIKIYGTKPGLNKTSMINVNDKAFMTDSSVAKLIGTKAAMSDSLTKLAGAKTAMTDASIAKKAPFAFDGVQAPKTESVKIKTNVIKAPLSDSSMSKFTGNNMPDILIKTNAMAESFPRGKENETKSVCDITRLIGTKRENVMKNNGDFTLSMPKDNEVKAAINDSFTTKFVENKPNSLTETNGTITQNMTETGAKPSPKDDLNGNFNKVLKSSNAFCDDNINDNIINEPVPV